MSRATLLQFAEVNDRAAATTKKLEKHAILAEYFRGLDDDDDLRRAVRYAAGRAFAAVDERVLNVGGALVSDVALAILRLDPGAYHDLVVRSGEIGEALAEVWDARPESPAAPPRDAHLGGGDAPPAPLTLADLARAFDALASTGQWDAKRTILLDLFSRCATGREAAYLSKIIFGDLRTGVQEGVLHDAIAKAFGRERPAVQRCQLLVGDLGEVAVLAKHDACGTARFRLFHPVQFMLATPVEHPAAAADALDGKAFFAEDKLDGIRAQVHKSGGTGPDARVAIYTRTMDRTDASFPDVVEAVAALPGEFLLDGEIVPWCDGCVLPFAHIQKRLGRKVLTPKILRDNPAAFVAFDVLYRDGELLMDQPLRERRAALDSLACGSKRQGDKETRGQGEGGGERQGDGSAAALSSSSGSAVSLSPCPRVSLSPAPAPAPALLTTSITEVTTADEVAAVFAAARERRNEGIILKDPASPYSPGRRGQMWFKLKTHLPTLDCVVTAAEHGHGKRRNVLSDYTFAVWDRDPSEPGAALVNVGKAYSGVTDEEIAQLTELFLKLARGKYGRVYAVEPKVVLEIACDQIQASKRHASGYALRFPRIKRIRWDKRPEDADRLSRVAEVFQSTPNFARPTRVPEPEPVEPAEPTLFDL
jgi:DNA ligase-1